MFGFWAVVAEGAAVQDPNAPGLVRFDDMTAAPYEQPLYGRPPGGTRWEATPIFDALLKERNGAPPGTVIVSAKTATNKAKRSGKNRPRARKG